MDQAVRTELRNAPDKKRLEIRKKDPLELEEFLKEWRSLLRNPGTVWQGPRAVAELRRKKMLEFLLCERKSPTEWQAEDLLSRVLDEMKSYRKEAGGRLHKEYFDDMDEFLKNELKRIQKQEHRARIQELKSLLQDLRKEVEWTQTAVGQLKKRKTNWHFGVWRHFWPEIPRKNLVSGKAGLDTRLQIELGKMFADYLRPERISLETIARLILLAYWAGGLSGMDGEDTRQQVKQPGIASGVEQELLGHGSP